MDSTTGAPQNMDPTAEAPTGVEAPVPQVQAPVQAPVVPGVAGGNRIIPCVFCKQRLAYPESSRFIKCPQCESCMDPQENPPTCYRECTKCDTLLSFDLTALTIQCPTFQAVIGHPEPAPVKPAPTKRKRKNP